MFFSQRKRGIFWDQLVGDLTSLTGELANTLSLYGLSIFKLDDEEEDTSSADETLTALGEGLNNLAEVIAEIEGMWDM